MELTELQEAIIYLKKRNNMSNNEIAKELRCSSSHVKKTWRKYRNGKFDIKPTENVVHNKNISQEANPKYKECKQEYSKDTGSLNIKSYTIKSLDDALKASNVDLTKWEVDRYLINNWQTPMKLTKKEMDSFRKDRVEFYIEEENFGGVAKTKSKPIKLTDAKRNSTHTETPVQVTNYQVKVWLKKLTPNKWETAVNDLIKTIPSITKDFFVDSYRGCNSDIAGEIALYDAHIGKFSWNKETLMGNWDLSIATKAYLQGNEKGLSKIAMFNPSKIFFILGNDFMHFENIHAKTPIGGHSLDIDGRFQKVAKEAMKVVIEAVNMCRSVAPVEVKWVPGNHDLHVSYWLSLILEQLYMGDKYVTIDNKYPKDNVVNIDNGESHRKAELWGKLLVGWWHDASGRKLPSGINALAQWWPELWGKSIFRELHVGHKHKKVEYKTMPINTVGGTIIRQIPSLSSIDFWHSDNMFVDAVPAGESLIWSKEEGVIGHFTNNIKPDFN